MLKSPERWLYSNFRTQGSTLRPERLLTGFRHYIMRNVCHLRLFTQYATERPYEEHLFHDEMAAESFAQRFNDSMHDYNGNVNNAGVAIIYSGITECFQRYEVSLVQLSYFNQCAGQTLCQYGAERSWNHLTDKV